MIIPFLSLTLCVGFLLHDDVSGYRAQYVRTNVVRYTCAAGVRRPVAVLQRPGSSVSLMVNVNVCAVVYITGLLVRVSCDSFELRRNLRRLVAGCMDGA